MKEAEVVPQTVSFHRLFQACDPNIPLFLYEGHEITWATFSARVAGVRDCLASRDEQYWGICYDNPYETAIAFFGLWMASKTPVFLPNFLPGTLERLKDHLDGLVAEGSITSSLPRYALSEIAASDTPLQLPEQSRQTAVFFTSGSTGEPKRVEKTWTQIENEVVTHFQMLGPKMVNTLVLATVPCRHFYGFIWRLLFPMISGGIVDNRLFQSGALCDASPDASRPLVLISTPTFLETLPVLGDITKMGAIALVISSAGTLTQETANTFKKAFGAAPTEIFGSTETGGVAYRRLDESDAWRPLPGVEIQVNEKGGLAIRSPFVSLERWEILNDQVELTSQGDFHLRGRSDRNVKVGEKSLSLVEMESRLTAHPYVVDAKAVVLRLPELERDVVAAVLQLSPSGNAALANTSARDVQNEFRTYLSNWFDMSLLPRRFRYVSRLPQDELGKTSLDLLKCLFDHHLDPTEV